ncbi:MAG: hypothetical protein EXR79_05135 [Myxococcales bacterium]|nr:hypothetical protein [Myxococcales bacterium]
MQWRWRPVARGPAWPALVALRFAWLVGVLISGGERSAAAAEPGDVAARYAKVLQTELGLLEALDRLDRDVIDLDTRLLRAGAERARAADVLTQTEMRRAKAAADLGVLQAAVRDRLRAVLRIAQWPTLRFALGAKDFAESVVKDRLLRRLLVADRARLQQYRERLRDLDRVTRERNVALAGLEKLDLDLHTERARAEQERSDKVLLVQRIEEDRRFHESAVRDLDAAHRQLTARIATLQEWQERKYTFALVQGKLLPPVAGRVEVAFGDVRHPKFGTTTLHRGLDYRSWGAPGAAVRAVFWGRVAHVGWLTGYGETVILDHGRGWHTVYAHLEAVRVEVGQIIASRERLADVGASGSIKGRYLYFEIRHNGQPVDPADWFKR